MSDLLTTDVVQQFFYGALKDMPVPVSQPPGDSEAETWITFNDVSADSGAGTLCERKKESRRHRTRCNSARVEGDGGEDLRHEEGKTDRNGIAGNEEIKDRESCENSYHSKRDRGSNAEGKARTHCVCGDGSVSDLFDLMIEDVNGRLCLYDEETDKSTDRNEKILKVR